MKKRNKNKERKRNESKKKKSKRKFKSNSLISKNLKNTSNKQTGDCIRNLRKPMIGSIFSNKKHKNSSVRVEENH